MQWVINIVSPSLFSSNSSLSTIVCDFTQEQLKKLNLAGVHKFLDTVVGKAELQYVNTNTTSFCFLWELTFHPYILLPASSQTHDIPWEFDGMCSTRSLLSFAWFSVYFFNS